MGVFPTAFEDSDLSGLPASDPGNGEPYELYGVLCVGAFGLDARYSAVGHTHDDRYFTEAEVTAALAGKANTATTLAGYGITDALALSGGTLTGPVKFANDVYQKSADNWDRLYFQSNGATIYRAPLSSGPTHIFRNADNSTVMSIDGAGGVTALGAIAGGSTLTLSGVTSNRWSSVSGGESKWETDYAGTFVFSQLQSGQAMVVTLRTAEGKGAGFVHYDVAGGLGRLFKVVSQPGVPIRISPADVQAVQFGVDGSSAFSGLVSLGAYTFGTLPSASANSGKSLRITDRGQKQAYSDGTNWLFVHDNSVVV